MSSHVVVLQVLAKKCTKLENADARAERLFLLIKPVVLWCSRFRGLPRCFESSLVLNEPNRTTNNELRGVFTVNFAVMYISVN